ncbi:NAD-dependent epimerase/dehydratase [Cynara cardunculus var. scolymus]|uniref:Dihydroflavonol 4-reductase n=1 Tax=Cynara cardunculus var. scolymus TaxID=59895 RepID=A0A103YGS5_CYNCS|nr:NAD-dependent epimerase/dehydratase [Cynara cardunculus var. scolymus]
MTQDSPTTVCVTGAAGFIGSWLVMRLLERGYVVRATVRDPESHYSIIKQGQYVHLDDLCECHIYLYENPKARGRYICSSHDATIHQLARVIKEKWPEYHVPDQFPGIDKEPPIVSFSSKKLKEMGFEFKYDLEEMFKGAIDSCRDKGLLPYSTIKDHKTDDHIHV